MELAILQDVGYQIDRKNFYGRSIYNDNVTLTNEQGYSARENGQYVDAYNNATMGVGLHVFGSYNDITQKGNIFTNGYGATGIRVDGINNKVTANGADGDAVHFEFGANSIGGNTEYRGSYMRYKRKISNTGQMMDAKNYGFNEMTHYRDDYSITDLVNGDNNEKMASLTVNGKIEATGGGTANVNGSTAATKNLLPNETKNILTATNGVVGDLKNSQMPTEISGLLSATGKVENNSVIVTTHAANNIGNLTDNESVAFFAANNMANLLTDDYRKAQLVPLYNFDAVNAKIALSQIGNSDAAQMMSLAQKNSIVGKVISDRLTTAFSTETANFNVGGNNFADGDNGVVMGVNADYPASVDNNFRIKFNKDWGKLNGDAKYHDQAISGGYDRAFSENWRGGLFFSYNRLRCKLFKRRNEGQTRRHLFRLS